MTLAEYNLTMSKEREFFHEINNKMTMIQGKLYKLKRDASEEQKEDLAKIDNWCAETLVAVKEFRKYILEEK